MFQGDINPIGIDDKRNAIIGQNFRWPNATIPYVISTSYSKNQSRKKFYNNLKMDY